MIQTTDIAIVLDANHAPIGLVQDMADVLAEVDPNFHRQSFMDEATENLRRRLDREISYVHATINRR